MKTFSKYTWLISLLFFVTTTIAQPNSGQVTLQSQELTFLEMNNLDAGYELHYKTITVSQNTPIKLNISNNTSNALYIFTDASLNFVYFASSMIETCSVTLSSIDGVITFVSIFTGAYFDIEDDWFNLYEVNYSPRYSSDVSSYTGKLGVGIQNPVNRFEIWDGVDARFVFSGKNVTSGYATAHELNDDGYKISVASPTKDFRIALDGFDEFKIQPKSNFSLGRGSLSNLTAGEYNSAFGYQALSSLTTGSHNLAIGFQSLYSITSGSDNIGIGERAGRWTTNDWGPNTSASNSIFIGSQSRSLSDNDTNQIVIGYQAVGAGSNTVTLGNNKIVSTLLKGNIGIGKETPQYKVDVVGTARIEGNVSIIGGANFFAFQSQSTFSVQKPNLPNSGNPAVFNMPHYGIAAPSASDGAELWLSGRNGVRFFTNSSSMPTLNISKLGNVGIGTTTIPSGYKLAVAGKVIAEEVMIMFQTQWPDYVFDYDYPLMPIAEVESFVRKNSHLPGIPTAETVSEEGVSLGEMQRLLLQKVEELTLYIIQQDKEIKQLKEDLSAINSGN